jgi:hypothetical protein
MQIIFRIFIFRDAGLIYPLIDLVFGSWFHPTLFYQQARHFILYLSSSYNVLVSHRFQIKLARAPALCVGRICCKRADCSYRGQSIVHVFGTVHTGALVTGIWYYSLTGGDSVL